MKIEKFENDKVKVTLTLEDLMLYDISGEAVTPDSPKLHKFLFQIMESVKEKTGFNPYNGQVVVEAVQDTTGITLFISKLKTIEEISIKKTSPEKIKSVKVNIHKSRYIFKNFDILCDAFYIVNEEDLKNSSLYKYEGKFYISVPSKKTALNSVLREYCDLVSEGLFSDLFLKEHGELIARDEKLVSMVKGIKALD